MCSRFWNSIIIAEKIIDAKAVRSISHKSVTVSSSLSQLMSVDSDYGTYNEKNDFLFELNNDNDDKPKIKPTTIFDNVQQCSQIAQSITSNNMPDWLKNDLQEAEFIPIDGLKVINVEVGNNCGQKDSSLNNSSKKTLENTETIIVSRIN
jgi:hypothetical protein